MKKYLLNEAELEEVVLEAMGGENIRRYGVDVINLYQAVMSIPDSALKKEDKIGLINSLAQNLEKEFIGIVCEGLKEICKEEAEKEKEEE